MDRVAKLDELFAAWSEPGAPGGVVTVLDGDAVVAQRAYGLADIEHGVANAAETRFHIASVSKSFVGAALVLLHGRKALGLDDDVRDHVAEMRHHGRITLRQLLTMTSGLRDSMETMRARGVWYRCPRSHRDLLDLLFAQSSLSYPTGERYAYTNINYGLLSEVIARVSGQGFESFLSENLWRPLGMRRTLLRDNNTDVTDGLAEAYIKTDDGYARGVWAFGIAGAGGLVSDADDLVTWLQALRRGEVGGEPVTAAMATRGRLNDGSEVNYGLGLAVRDYRGVRLLHHGGSLPGYKAQLAFAPEHGFGLVLLSNREDADPYAKLRQVAEIYLEDAFTTPPPRTPVPVPATLPGRYLDPESGEVLELALEDGTLTGDKLGFTLPFWGGDSDRLVCDWANFTATLTPLVDGRVELDFGGQKGVFERLPEDAPADELDAYAGRYRNDEIDGELTVTRAGDGLRLRYGPRFNGVCELALEPVAKGVFRVRFEVDGWRYQHAVRFAGDAVLVSSDRLKDVRFTKVTG